MLRPGRPTPQALKLFENCCWGLGLALVLTHLASTLSAQYGSRSALEAFEESRAGAAPGVPWSADDSRPHAGLVYAQPDQSAWSAERVRRYAEARWAVPFRPEAVIRIAALGLEVPVFPGATEVNMNRGAGRIAGSPRFG
jgi:hypothetical protein